MAVVDRAGRLVPGSGLPPGAEVVIETVLRLNAERLVEARKTVIGAEVRRLAKIKDRERGLTPSRRTKLAAELRTRAETAEYGSALLMLADRLERGGAGR
ncbi:hypothetical protein [Nocardia sp. NPDC057353]|uniref:hypothetical protein n=1 Tax=Nocardia sp. NPDC057353 TaxID=3346104 RepID=UPI00363E273B